MESKMNLSRRAVFLDRDGVINYDHGYVHQWEDFEFIPGALEAAARLVGAGWLLVVVTNQSGIARGYYTVEVFQILMRRMIESFSQHDAPITAVYFCPHLPSASPTALATACQCRKPAPGMILRAAHELGLSLQESVMIGDMPSDIAAARAAGVGRAFLIQSARQELSGLNCNPDGVFRDLCACVDSLLEVA